VLAGPITLRLEGGEEVVIRSDHYSLTTRIERRTVEPYLPHVVEPAFGLSRIIYCVLETSYEIESAPASEVSEEGATDTEEGASSTGYVRLRIPPTTAPIKLGVFPLMYKDGLAEIAAGIERDSLGMGLITIVDLSQSIGRRYARADEIGVPFCITVDYQTKEDGTVTLRERDSRLQRRLSIPQALAHVQGAVRKTTT